MPHQDHPSPNTSAPHAQDLLQVFRQLLKETRFSGLPTPKDSRWSFRGLVITTLLWVWSDEPALTSRFALAARLAGETWRDDVPETISYQAFLKRLVRWTESLLQVLQPLLRRSMQDALPASWNVAGRCVFGVDGSKLELPRTRSHQTCFSPGRSSRPRREHAVTRQASRSRRRKANSPQLQITTLWHAGTGLPWDWRLGPADSSERGHLREMLPCLPERSLLTADAGFVGYELWSQLQAAGHDLLIRVGSNVRLLKKLGVVREANDTVYLWPEACGRRGQPPIVLRLVIVQGARHPWYLVTSVRDRKQLSDRDVAEIYRRRWGVEVFYRHFKQTFARRKLRSHVADHALCEAAWSMLGLWGMLLQGARQLEKKNIPLRRISVAGVLRVFRKLLRTAGWRLESAGEFERDLSAAVIDTYERKSKKNRGYPQKKYESPCGPPKIQKATRQETLLARTLKTGLTA